MKKIIETWKCGWVYLLTDDLISYYTFFTIILAECCYLFAFHEKKTSLVLGAILIGFILTVLITARLKYSINYVHIAYAIAFIALLIAGCFINYKLFLPLIIIPLIVTPLSMGLRSVQNSFVIKPPKFETIIRSFCLFATVIAPFILFTVFFAMIPSVPVMLKIIVPIVYLVLSPFIAYIEDDWATCNIFELFFD